MQQTQNILLQILQETEDRGLSLGKTQLIKFLYLTEVEFYRESGKRATELDWIFHLYGPYAYEIESILAQPEFQKQTSKTAAEKDFIHYMIAESKKEYGAYVDPKISLIVKKVVSRWGKASLSELLDYVYFETEPMQHVKMRGERLDFSAIKRAMEHDTVLPIKASKEANQKVEIIRSKVRSFFEEMGQSNIVAEVSSSDYLEALNEWEKEDGQISASPTNFIINFPNSSATKGS